MAEANYQESDGRMTSQKKKKKKSELMQIQMNIDE